MKRLVIIVVIAGLGYWYWSRPHEESPEARTGDRLSENAAIIQQCINEERRVESAGAVGGLVDVGSTGADAETVCAQKNGLQKRDGKWYAR